MKRIIVFTSVAAAVLLSGLIWLVLRRSVPADKQEANDETVVAVRLGQIRRMTLRAYVTAYGIVEPEPYGARPAAGARVTAAVPGVITSVRCVEGRAVDKGALLFQLDSRVADVAAERARSAVEFAETSLARQQKLIQVEGTSTKLVQEAESALAAARSDLAAARAQQALLRVESPLSGTVTRVNVEPGEAVDSTTTLAEVVDLDRLVVSAGVPSAELALLRRGYAADIVVSEMTQPLHGRVSVISPRVDPATGTAPVRVSLPAGSGLLPGQVATLRIVSDERKDRLAVPAASVVRDENGASVVALVQEGIARQTPVKTGLRDGDWIEVEGAGLADGLSVVTEGSYGLPRQTRIRVLGQ